MTQTKWAEELTGIYGKINGQYQGNFQRRAWANIRACFQSDYLQPYGTALRSPGLLQASAGPDWVRAPRRGWRGTRARGVRDSLLWSLQPSAAPEGSTAELRRRHRLWELLQEPWHAVSIDATPKFPSLPKAGDARYLRKSPCPRVHHGARQVPIQHGIRSLGGGSQLVPRFWKKSLC